MAEESPLRGPRGRLHLPTWSKECWRGRPSGMCWLCRLRLLGQLFFEERSEVETCPGCGEGITGTVAETPDGYDDVHCRRCAREIEQRQDWFMNTATPIGGSN